jgi:hypothetical protein
VKRKVSVVVKLLRGEDLETLAAVFQRNCGDIIGLAWHVFAGDPASQKIHDEEIPRSKASLPICNIDGDRFGS